MATGDCPLEHVNLRRCHLGGSLTSMILGVRALTSGAVPSAVLTRAVSAADVLRNPASRLKSLDLSSNQLGMASVFAIQSVGCAFEGMSAGVALRPSPASMFDPGMHQLIPRATCTSTRSSTRSRTASACCSP